MEDEIANFITIIALGFSAAIVIRIVLHHLDKGRIMSAAREKGWRNVTVSWSPFAPGWLFERSERNYRVKYEDRNGTKHMQYCKTSMFTGVYWRD